MNKKLIKMMILAVASGFAVAPIANAQKPGDAKAPVESKPEAPKTEAPDSAAPRERPAGGPRGQRPDGAPRFDREAMMKKFDKDNSGDLNEAERAEMMKAMAEERKVRAAEDFKKRDKDGNGKLSLAEFKEGGRGGDRADAMFKTADADNDGFVTSEELEKARPQRGAGRQGGPRPDGTGGQRGPRGPRPDGAPAPKEGAPTKRPAADKS